MPNSQYYRWSWQHCRLLMLPDTSSEKLLFSVVRPMPKFRTYFFLSHAYFRQSAFGNIQPVWFVCLRIRLRKNLLCLCLEKNPSISVLWNWYLTSDSKAMNCMSVLSHQICEITTVTDQFVGIQQSLLCLSTGIPRIGSALQGFACCCS